MQQRHVLRLAARLCSAAALALLLLACNTAEGEGGARSDSSPSSPRVSSAARSSGATASLTPTPDPSSGSGGTLIVRQDLHVVGDEGSITFLLLQAADGQTILGEAFLAEDPSDGSEQELLRQRLPSGQYDFYMSQRICGSEGCPPPETLRGQAVVARNAPPTSYPCTAHLVVEEGTDLELVATVGAGPEPYTCDVNVTRSTATPGEQ